MSGCCQHNKSNPNAITTTLPYVERAYVRNELRQSWNYDKYSFLKKPMTTPFRVLNNAGDQLDRKSYSCSKNSIGQSKPNLHGLKSRYGGGSNTCIPSIVTNILQLNPTIPAANCNNKYVYDGSDFITYKKKLAILKTYNDKNAGGDNHNASQSVLKAVRRY